MYCSDLIAVAVLDATIVIVIFMPMIVRFRVSLRASNAEIVRVILIHAIRTAITLLLACDYFAGFDECGYVRCFR